MADDLQTEITADNDHKIVLAPNGHADRRLKRRFRIEQECRYRVLYGHRIAESGVGRTVNMSSSGVWLTTETVLPAGLPVELSINWPAMLNQVCPMKLMIFGCVIRSDTTGAAISVERYEFRTQGARAFQAPLNAAHELRLPT